MKALSLRQPWAHAVLHLGKRVENRDWAGCSYRGPILIHASKTLVLRDFDECMDSIINIVNAKPGNERLEMLKPLAYMSVPLRSKHHGEVTWRPAPTLPIGGIVGRARIVDVVHPGGRIEGPISEGPLRSGPDSWYTGGFALVLAEVKELPFIPWRGSLGLFDIPDSVTAALIAECATAQTRAT